MMNGKCTPKSHALGQHNPCHSNHASETGAVVQLGHGLAVSDGFPGEPGQNEYERRRMATGGFEDGQEANE